MKISHKILVLSFLPTVLWAQRIALPQPIKQSLDSLYHGWRLSPVTVELANAFFSSDTLAGSVVQADFDDSGSKDYAVQITCELNRQLTRIILLYLSKGKDFSPLEVTSFPEDDQYYLGVRTKGTIAYDFRKEKYFHFQSDALEIGFAGKAGVSYILKGKSFQEVVTAD